MLAPLCCGVQLPLNKHAEDPPGAGQGQVLAKVRHISSFQGAPIAREIEQQTATKCLGALLDGCKKRM